MNKEKEKTLQSAYVGLDIAKEEIEICVIDMAGTILSQFKLDNNFNGYCQLINQVPSHNSIVFGLESTGPYSGNITHFLRKTNVQLVLTDPFKIARLRDVFAKSVKTDLIDSYVIAQALRMNVLKDSQKEAKYVYLQDLLERNYDLVDRRTALSNQLRSNLIETFPEIDQCFAKISCHTALSILKCYQSAEELLEVGESGIRQLIRRVKGYMKVKQLKQLLESCKMASGWKTTSYHKFIIKSQVEELVMVNDQINRIQEMLDEYCAQFEREIDLLTSVPGISKQTSLLYLAVVGDVKRFDTKNDGKGSSRVSSYLGFGLKEYSSGFKSYKLGISKRGNSRLRGLLYMAALTAIRYDSDLKRRFERLKQKKGSGKKTVVAIGHTLLRRSYGVLRSGRMYDCNIPLSQAA